MGGTNALQFHLSQRRNPKIIIGFNFDYLTFVKQEMVQILNDFDVMSSLAMITLDQEDDSSTNEYLGEFMVKKKNHRFKIVYSLHCFIFFPCLFCRENI